MIEARALTKRYGAHLALDDVSFNAAPGEILGLLGPNGAGKTTTMRILTGYMPPSSGTASVAGFDVLDDSMDVRRRVGYMPERVPIYPDMTVHGYVMFWARLRGVRKAKARVDEALERVRLTERRHSLLRNLSKGLVQRVGLAQALVHDPAVVILDEPTIGIDPQQVIEVREYVRQLGRDHTVLFSTHILSEAEQVCDRVIIINRGRLVAQGKPEALRRQLDPGDHIYVMVRGEVKRVRSVLENVAGVERVETNGPGFSVRAKKGADIRARIAEAVAQASLPLLEMRPVAMTLEDIFLDIVGREG